MAKKMSGMARKMMNPKGGKSMGTGGRTKNPLDKMDKTGPNTMHGAKGMKMGEISSTTSNTKY